MSCILNLSSPLFSSTKCQLLSSLPIWDVTLLKGCHFNVRSHLLREDAIAIKSVLLLCLYDWSRRKNAVGRFDCINNNNNNNKNSKDHNHDQVINNKYSKDSTFTLPLDAAVATATTRHNWNFSRNHKQTNFKVFPRSNKEFKVICENSVKCSLWSCTRIQ